MAGNFSVLSPELILDSETLKYLLLFASAAGLLILARWASRLGGSDASASYPQVPELDAPVPAEPAGDPKSALNFLPPDPRLGSIRIASFYFSKFDAVPGPPDSKCFCDELFVELYDTSTDYSWSQSFLVATPEGLAEVLREKSWKYLRAGSLIIVPRYDLQDIREAVVDYIVEDQKLGPIDEGPREHAG